MNCRQTVSHVLPCLRNAVRILLATLMLTATLSCVRHMRIDMTPEEGTRMLYMAKRGWPAETHKGMVGVGTVRPLNTLETHTDKEIRAEHAAMIHILHDLMKGGFPREITEEKFMGCMEKVGESVWERTLALDSGFVEVQIYIPDRFVNELLDCLYKTFRGQQK